MRLRWTIQKTAWKLKEPAGIRSRACRRKKTPMKIAAKTRLTAGPARATRRRSRRGLRKKDGLMGVQAAPRMPPPQMRQNDGGEGRAEVGNGVQGDAPVVAGSRVAEPGRDIGVAGLVVSDRENPGDGDDRVFGGGHRVCEEINEPTAQNIRLLSRVPVHTSASGEEGWARPGHEEGIRTLRHRAGP
jgi:hypothetical protein